MEINRINYEKFFLLYLDRELNPAEMQEVEKFLVEHTDLQKEFSLLQQTIFMPEEIVFEQKELLIRREEKRRVVPFYRMRMAAAVAALILAGWFIVSQGIHTSKTNKKNTPDTIAKNALKKNAPAVTPTDQKNSGRESEIADQSNISSSEIADKNNPANIAAGKEISGNKTQGKSSIGENNSVAGTVNINETSGKHGSNRVSDQSPSATQNQKQQQNQGGLATINGQNAQNPMAGKESGKNIPDESSLAVQKSSAALEIQTAAMRAGTDPRSVSSQPGNVTPVLIAANGNTASPGYENAILREPDLQTDNAISVVALNDPNKGISKFFKKLTTRATETENARKIRVSVFQISY